jgi:hypothetical protein
MQSEIMIKTPVFTDARKGEAHLSLTYMLLGIRILKEDLQIYGLK